jgi:hypothetical protein
MHRQPRCFARWYDAAVRLRFFDIFALMLAGAVGCARSALSVDAFDGAAGSRADPGGDREHCRSLTLESEVEAVPIPGTVLLVFDRSGSMTELWHGLPRWQTAGKALHNVLMTQPSTLGVGAVFFPSPDEAATCVGPTDRACELVARLCEVAPIHTSAQIDFAPAPAFLIEFNGNPENRALPKYAPVLGGNTPLGEALVVAQTTLHDLAPRGVTTVVIITDGRPNCDWDAELATRVVEGWHAAGIRTYVVGLPGIRSDTQVILDDLAASGGTETFITPDDAPGLEQRFGEILLDNVSVGFESCTLAIDPPPRTTGDVRVMVGVDGRERAIARVDETGVPAWNVRPDGSAVDLVGGTCAAAMRGDYDSIRVEFDCVTVPR